VWHDFSRHQSPEDFYISLNDSDRRTVDSWRERRQVLVQTSVRQQIDAKLSEIDDESSSLLGTPFLRVLVGTSVDPIHAQQRDEIVCEEAMLTIWNPSEEQQAALKEGAVVRFKNISVRDSRYDGLLQLVANGRTPLSTASSSPPKYLLDQFHPRRDFGSIAQITSLSKQAGVRPGKQRPFEVDVIGVVLKAESFDLSPFWLIHMTDISGLLLRIQCNTLDKGDFRPLLSFSSSVGENIETPLIAAFRHLRVLPYDDIDGCAVVDYRETSAFIQSPDLSPRLAALRKWTACERGSSCLRKVAVTMDAKIPCSSAAAVVAIGFISDFLVVLDHQLLIEVDCGVGGMKIWKFPLGLVQDFLAICGDSRGSVVLHAEAEQRISRLTNLEQIFRARQNPFRFELQRLHAALSTDYPDCQYEVMNVTKVDIEALAMFYNAQSLCCASSH